MGSRTATGNHEKLAVLEQLRVVSIWVWLKLRAFSSALPEHSFVAGADGLAETGLTVGDPVLCRDMDPGPEQATMNSLPPEALSFISIWVWLRVGG